MAVSGNQPWWGGDDLEFSRAEGLVAELDNQYVGDESSGWVIAVLGVYVSTDDIWMQIAPVHDTDHGLVLHFSERGTADQALAALAEWSKAPVEHRPRVLEVRHVTGSRKSRTLQRE